MPVNRVIASLIADGDRDIIARMLSESGQDDVAGTVRSGSLLAAGNNHQIAESWQKIAPHHGIETIAALINDVGKSAAAFTAKPVPDLQNTIEVLANRGYKLGLATSDSYDSAMATLSPFNILGHFDFVCGSQIMTGIF